MILLDTHAWVWWVHDEERLTANQLEVIRANETDTIGVSAISCWEIAKGNLTCLTRAVANHNVRVDVGRD